MTMKPFARLKLSFFLIAFFFCAFCSAQTILNRPIPSFEINRQRLDNVLEILSNKGNFYFSYNSNIINKDSLITFSASNRTVKQILDALFQHHYEFTESGNYIIIRRAPIKLTVVTNKAITEDKVYVVSGYILDEQSGMQIHNASIYEKKLLVSALTNEEGYFKIRLKSKSKTAALSVSKEFYEDTTVVIEPRYNQQITITIVPIETSVGMITISPDDYFVPDSLKVRVIKDSLITEYTYVKVDSGKVEKTGMARFLLSSRQRIQTINLRKFFTERPFQLSLTPGLGTQGKLSPQVINNFSLNVFGGYNGGINGIEIGGLFNIDKKDVRYFQVGGLFNIVGGYMKGMQVAGITNTVLDTVSGFQAAGVNNMVKGKFSGIQVGGVYNHVSDSVKGLQVAGVGNFAKNKVRGVQIAGVANISNREIKGAQIAGLVNYAKRLKGLQIGVINIADSSDGYSIGLINIVLNGYHKLAFSSNEMIDANVAFKTGNAKLYSILMGGSSIDRDRKMFAFGYGLGSDFSLGRHFSVNPEISAQHLYLGSWDHLNLLNRAQLNFTLKFGKYVSIFGGPVFSVYYTHQTDVVSGYKSPAPPAGYRTYDFSDRVKGWIGWNAGISFF